VAKYYSDDLPYLLTLPTEYDMWVRKWKQHGSDRELPKKLVDLVEACSPLQFPNLVVLLV